MIKFIPFDCVVCGCMLFSKNGVNNYVYRENKKGYYYVCKKCFLGGGK